MICQFDGSKREAIIAFEGLGLEHGARVVAELSMKMDNMDVETTGTEGKWSGEETKTDIDNNKGWIDNTTLLGEDKQEQFHTTILSIKLALVKVSWWLTTHL